MPPIKLSIMTNNESSYNPFIALSEEIKTYLADMEMRITLRVESVKSVQKLNDSALVDVAEVRKQLNIKDSRTIWSMVDKGVLPCVRTEGNQYRFKQSDITAYMERRTQKKLNASDFLMPSLRPSKSR